MTTFHDPADVAGHDPIVRRVRELFRSAGDAYDRTGVLRMIAEAQQALLRELLPDGHEALMFVDELLGMLDASTEAETTVRLTLAEVEGRGAEGLAEFIARSERTKKSQPWISTDRAPRWRTTVSNGLRIQTNELIAPDGTLLDGTRFDEPTEHI